MLRLRQPQEHMRRSKNKSYGPRLIACSNGHNERREGNHSISTIIDLDCSTSNSSASSAQPHHLHDEATRSPRSRRDLRMCGWNRFPIEPRLCHLIFRLAGYVAQSNLTPWSPRHRPCLPEACMANHGQESIVEIEGPCFDQARIKAIMLGADPAKRCGDVSVSAQLHLLSFSLVAVGRCCSVVLLCLSHHEYSDTVAYSRFIGVRLPVVVRRGNTDIHLRLISSSQPRA